MVNNGRVLVMCTGNVCRSPYLEYRLRAELDDFGFAFASAGTNALHGSAMDEGSARLLRQRNINPTPFVAQQMSVDALRWADLVISASREHLGLAAQLVPAVLRRGFALNDLADLLADARVAEIEGSHGDNRAQRVASCALSRRTEVVARSAADATIHDPYGGGTADFDEMDRQIAMALPSVLRALAG